MSMQDVKTVAVVGGGLIGASWAALFTAGDIDVIAWDPDATARAMFRDRVKAALGQAGMQATNGFTSCTEQNCGFGLVEPEEIDHGMLDIRRRNRDRLVGDVAMALVVA